MLAEIKSDVKQIADEKRRDELFSEINVIEKSHRNLRKCVSVYRKCEKELNR